MVAASRPHAESVRKVFEKALERCPKRRAEALEIALEMELEGACNTAKPRQNVVRIRAEMAIESAPKWRSNPRRNGDQIRAEMANETAPRWRPKPRPDGAQRRAPMAPKAAPEFRINRRRNGDRNSAELAPKTAIEMAIETTPNWHLKQQSK